MFIQTENTPNPATIKFIPGHPVSPRRGLEFRDSGEAAAAPLALRLFKIEGIASIFMGSDFVSVSKDNACDWSYLKPQVLAAIMEHYLTGLPAVEDVSLQASPDSSNIEDEVVKQIRELLDTRVRPAVARDGGDIEFVKFEEGIVWLHMKGACAGCPSSTATLKVGIENMLKHFVPEIIAVEQYSGL